MLQDTPAVMNDEIKAAEPEITEAAESIVPPVRPADVPEKFWDASKGDIRTEALLKSYVELERKMSAFTQSEGSLNEGARGRLLELLGRPPSADEYQIEPPHGMIVPDPALNVRLHAAGFTQPQAQLVYELAAERLLPAVSEIAGELEAQRQIDRLQQHFGGADAWRGVAGQIRTWAEANLEPHVYSALTTSHDGVLALHQMMRAAEPTMIETADAPAEAVNDDVLGEMVRDPRYWRQRDPDFIARVTQGFKKLYGT